MPAISNIRFTNVVYENGQKRYRDEIFKFDGFNGAILLENGGGKTVFIQTLLQTIMPHCSLANRKIKDTLALNNSTMHIAVEWILQEYPREYGLTAVTLFVKNDEVHSHRYTYRYAGSDKESIGHLPFTMVDSSGRERPAAAEEMHDYYVKMKDRSLQAQLFATISEYRNYLESNFKIIGHEWESMATINSGEGDVAKFFEECKTTNDLVNKLLISTVLLAIHQDNSVSFADLFEEKRMNLKKYNQLKRQIKENEAVERKIMDIMKIYEVKNNKELEYLALKKRAKAFYEETKRQQHGVFEEARQVGEKRGWLLAQQQKVAEQEQSLDIAYLQEQAADAEKEYQKHTVAYEQLQDKLQKYQQEKTRFLYLRTKQDRDSQLIQMGEEQQRLAQKEHVQQDSELEAELEITLGQLRYLYDLKEQLHDQELHTLKQQQSLINSEIKQYDTEIESLQASRHQYDILCAQCNTTIAHLQSDLQTIAKSVLANSDTERVDEEIIIWKQKAEQIQQSVTKEFAISRQQEDEKNSCRTKVDALKQQEKEVSIGLEATKGRLGEQTRRHENALSELRILPGLRLVDSIYNSMGKITATMENQRHHRMNELEIARSNERRDFRLVDLYGQQEIFMLDEYMETFLDEGNFAIESGTAYAERLVSQGYISKDKLLDNFPLWPLCIIVQEKDKIELQKRLHKVHSKLTTPVFVLTNGEARSAADGTYSYAAVVPEFWSTVMERHSFAQWKEQLWVIASNSKATRAEKETLKQQLDVIDNLLQQFIAEFPHEQYKLWQKEQTSFEEKLADLKKELHLAEQGEQIAEKAFYTSQQQIKNLELAEGQISKKIERGMEWLQKQRQVDHTRQEQAQHQSQVRKVAANLLECQELRSGAVNAQEDISSHIVIHKEALNQLQGEELYQKLQDYSPIQGAYHEGELKEKKSRLTEQLAKVIGERQAIEHRIQKCKKEWDTLNNRLAEYNVDVDEHEVFPGDGETRIKILGRDIAQLTDDNGVVHENYIAAMTERAKVNACLIEKTNTYYKQNPGKDIHVFTESLALSTEKVQAEKKEVTKEQHINEEKYMILHRREEQWQHIDTILEKNNVKFEFLGEQIEACSLSSEEKNDFLYQSNTIIQHHIESFNKTYAILLESQTKAQEVREKFISYCQTENFQNEKMRQGTLSAIRQKTTYQQIMDWAKESAQRIKDANEFAQQNMRTYHEDINHFINQLHLYLVTICDEIRNIQKMTTVKIEDHYKAIYEFKTPVWEETIGKEKLLAHMEWMVEQLISDQYKNDDGLDDNKKVRKAIEKWLSPAVLFNRISPNKGFTVGVRKVSNQNSISNVTVEWTTSNSWSGGEKWSKNMALFLGIQSYLADKCHPMKRRRENARVVVLDNPFGQASSDHVLEPVFFIAEKLGFQVIALTALAEGKFLRDYFPIIYSCRLRAAGGGETALMDKETYINYAYFQDHAPQSVNRLGEVKQITLL